MKLACTATGAFGTVKVPSSAIVRLPSLGLVTSHPANL